MDVAPVLRLGRTGLPIVATLLLVLPVGATLVVAGETLGFDFLAYHAAAVRILDGQPLYDLGFQATGGFGLFYYPPMFAPLILPFGLLSEMVAVCCGSRCSWCRSALGSQFFRSRGRSAGGSP